MHLTRLSLTAFRSHRSASLMLDKGLIAVFGPNGAGKTNLIEAVSMLSPGRGLRRAATGDLMRRETAIGWKIGAEIGGGALPSEVETWAEPGATRQIRIDGKATSQLALGRIAPMLWLVPSMDRLWVEGPDGRRRFIDRIAMSFQPAHAEAVLAYDRAMRDRNRLLRDRVDDPRWYLALEDQMDRHGTAIRDNRAKAVDALIIAQGYADTAFPAADLTVHVDDHTPLAEALARSRRADLAAGRSLVGPHRDDLSALYAEKAMPASQCSTGEQKALLISIVLANARALADRDGTPPILLLDEVAAHLDAGRRAALYAELQHLDAQAWMTGTEAELFADLPTPSRRIEVQDHAGESRLREV